MRTFSSIKGLPVYERNSGEIIGKILDISISETGEIKGFLIDEKGFLGRNRLLDIDSIVSFGRDVVMIKNSFTLQPLTLEEGDHLFYKHGGLAGKEILTESGNKLGLLDDVYFGEEVGTIIGYEVSDGFFTDLTDGKKMITPNQVLKVGKDAVVVLIQ